MEQTKVQNRNDRERKIMRKKTETVVFAVVVTASFIPGGCGEPQETGGRAKRTE